jgi:hypothetical protein
MDETLYNVSEMVQNFAVIYLGKSPVSLVVLALKLTIQWISQRCQILIR